MEVRCERCKTEYDFEDTSVPEAGVAVQCTTCGHVFKVKKKAVLVTMPLQPGDMTPVGTAIPEPVRAPAPPAQREWKVRQANGNCFTFRELTTLQKWIVERKVGRDDEISLAGTEHWKRLGNISALVPFFNIVEKAQNGPHEAPDVVNDHQPPSSEQPSGALSTPAVYPPIASPSAQSAPSSADSGPVPLAATGPTIHRFPSVPSVIVQEFGDEDAEALKTDRGAWFLLLLMIVLLGGGGYFGYMYYWHPQQQREQAAARESARAAQVQAEKDRAAALARSKAIEEARAKIAQEAKTADEGPSSQAVSPPDAGVHGVLSILEPTTTVVKKDAPSDSAQRSSRPEPPRNFDFYMTQGYRYLEKQNPMLAVESFGKAADLRPDRAEPFGGRGLALLKMGDLTQAEASFQEALKVNPNFGIAVIGLAKTYLSLGRKDKAADYYGKYLEILPDGPEANGAKLALKRLRQE